MDKFIAYGYIFLSMVSWFLIGTYATSVMYDVNSIEPHQWVITLLCGLMFIALGIDRVRKL